MTKAGHLALREIWFSLAPARTYLSVRVSESE